MNRTVFITGASAGFGAAAARQFAARGDRLILAARRTSPLQALRDELGGQTAVHTLQLDVRDRQAVERAVANLPEAFREVDILLNNAGLALGLEARSTSCSTTPVWRWVSNRPTRSRSTTGKR